MEKIWEYLSDNLAQVKFQQMKDFSPYCEMEEDCIKHGKQGKQILELNSFYRYEDIFYSLFVQEDLSEEVRNWLFDVMFHYIVCLEFGQGCSGHEIRIRKEQKNLLSNVYGKKIAEWYKHLTKEQKYLIGYYMECQRTSGASIHTFASAITGLLECVVYKNLIESKTLIVYVSESKSQEMETTIQCVEELLLPLDYEVRTLYREHIGILGEDNTMMVEEIIIF